jgi:hypothetical protein
MPAPQDGVMASVGTVSAEGTRLNPWTPETAARTAVRTSSMNRSFIAWTLRSPARRAPQMRERASARA